MTPRKRLTPASAARRVEVIKMRRARLTFAQIGDRLGISQQRAGQIYRAALSDIPAQQVDEHRAEELELIDLAVNRLMSIAADPETSPRTRVEAWSAIRGWSERKSKLLGLDSPSKHEVITLDAINAEIEKLAAELAAGSDDLA
jgi:hypothetical protein